jgi:hypothetical protein
MTDRLAALVKCVAELRQAGLEVCHCIKEFHVWWIQFRLPTDGRSQP